MKTLIIKSNSNSHERYYNEQISQFNDVIVLNPFKINTKLRKIFNYFNLPGQQFFYNKKIVETLNNIDLIIVFDFWGYSRMVKWLKKFNKRIVIWHWNILKDAPHYLREYKKTKFIGEHWTFDEGDSEKYNMFLNNQFFFYQEKDINIEIKYDISFVGTNKGRYEKVKDIYNYIISLGRTEFIKMSGVDSKSNIKLENFMDYKEILEVSKKSISLLEISQEKQTGLTARAVESLFLKKKLITNNFSITQYDFYNKNNILLLDKSWKENLDYFFNTDYEEIPKEIIYNYSFESWLLRIIGSD